MKRLLLRADASIRMGTGHVMRGIALAQAWQDLGGEVVLLSHDLPADLARRVTAEGIRLMMVSGDVEHDLRETCTAAADATWVVLDGYHFDASYCDAVIEAARHTLLVDDLGLLPHYRSELVLNQNITASETMYARRDPGTTLLQGGAFALLRREFRRPPVMHETSAPCERVLVTFGGSDPDNVTSKVIEALQSLPHLHAKVIVGAVNRHRDELQQQCTASGGRIVLLPPVDDLVPLMDEAQVAVSAGGTSVLELASRGVPTLLLAIADNQRAICGTMHECGVMLSAGWHEDVSADELAALLRELSSDAAASQRAVFERRGRSLVDGRGSLRVAREMMARDAMTFVRVRRATQEDAPQVFEWANDPMTRSVSFNQNEIVWGKHVSWFTRKLASPACRLLIGEDLSGVAVGMVRFDLAQGVAVISINMAPKHRQRGLGVGLLLVACRALLQEGAAVEVQALIKPGNAASQRAFLRAGFEPAPDVDVAGQRALCMVLK